MAIQTTTFKGARYIVKFHDPIQWNATESYEAIEAVQYNAFTYISKQPVPAGVQIDNEAFWLLWADPNAQMEQLRQLVSQYVEQVETLSGTVEDLSDDVEAFAAIIPTADFSADNTVKQYIDLDASKAHVFDTVADMKAADTLAVGTICHTNGFHAPDDGGAAWYEIKDTGTANEMDIIACGDLLAHLIIASDYVTPVMFGAYGDGTHGDSAAMQRAFDVFPFIDGLSKTYLFDNINYNSEDRIAGVIIENTCHVKNMKAVIASDATDYFTPFNVNGGESATFENVIIDGTHTGTHTALQDGGLSGIKTGFEFTGQLLVENCVFENCFTDGIQLRYSTNFTIRDSLIKANGRNGITANCKTANVENCRFEENGKRAAPYSQFHIEPDSLFTMDQLKMSGCYFKDTRLCSIKIDCYNGINIDKIIIEDMIEGSSTYGTIDSFDVGDRSDINIGSIIIDRCNMQQMYIRTATHFDSSTIGNLTISKSKITKILSTTAIEVMLEDCIINHAVQTFPSVSKFCAKNCKWDCAGISSVADCIPINNANPSETENYTSILFDGCEFVNVNAGIIYRSCKDATIINCRHMGRSSNLVPSGFKADYLLVSNCWFGATGSAASFTVDDTVPGCITGCVFWRAAYYSGTNIAVAGNKSLN